MMKTTYITRSLVLFFILFCGVVSKGYASDKMERSRMRIYYEKLTDDSKKLSVLLTKGKGKNTVGVEQAEVFLTALDGEEKIPLTSVITDENGEADLYFQADYEFPIDEEGFTYVIGEFQGNDSIKASDKEIQFRDLNIDVSFEIVDSINYITAFAYELDSAGEKSPIEEVKIKFGVERLLSTLYLEEIETDDEGIAEMEFPNDIPGDENGKIIVVVVVEDHSDYGTITKSTESNWGVIVDYSEHSGGRSLYGEEAPLWMTISIFVILIGAWFHFIFAGYKVYKMAKTDTKVIGD